MQTVIAPHAGEHSLHGVAPPVRELEPKEVSDGWSTTPRKSVPATRDLEELGEPVRVQGTWGGVVWLVGDAGTVLASVSPARALASQSVGISVCVRLAHV